MRDNGRTYDLARLLVRSVLGASIAAHGAQKLFGWFGGPGMERAGTMMESLGFRPGDRFARAASLAEIAAGVLTATGSGGPLGPAMLLGVMSTAAVSAHLKNGYWNQNRGYELNAMYALPALLLALDDHGAFSIDHAIGARQMFGPATRWIALIGAAAAAAYVLSQRTPPLQPQQATPPSEHGTIESSARSTT